MVVALLEPHGSLFFFLVYLFSALNSEGSNVNLFYQSGKGWNSFYLAAI